MFCSEKDPGTISNFIKVRQHFPPIWVFLDGEIYNALFRAFQTTALQLWDLEEEAVVVLRHAEKEIDVIQVGKDKPQVVLDSNNLPLHSNTSLQ